MTAAVAPRIRQCRSPPTGRPVTAAGAAIPELPSTGDMLRSFIFSKPGFTQAPFHSWGSCAATRSHQHQPTATTTRPQTSDGAAKAGPSQGPHHHPPPPPHRSHYAEETRTFHDQQDADKVVWKRRTFVEQVERVPELYRHRAIVPTTSSAPSQRRGGNRNAREGVVSIEPHYVHPEGGFVGPPVATSAGRITYHYLDSRREARLMREALASRVVHVQDTIVTARSPRRSAGHAPEAHLGQQDSATSSQRPATAPAPPSQE